MRSRLLAALGLLLLLSPACTAAEEPVELAWAFLPATTEDESFGGMRDAAVDAQGNVFAVQAAIRITSPATDLAPLESSADVVFHKLDAEGNEVWRTQISTPADERCSSIVLASGGDVYAAGWTRPSRNASDSREIEDLLLYRMSSEGDLVWRKTIKIGDGLKTLPSTFLSVRAAIDSAGNVYIAVNTVATSGPGPEEQDTSDSPRDILVLKVDSEGTVLWQKELGTPEDDAVHGMTVNENGEFYLVGSTAGDLFGEGQGGLDCFIVKYDSDGVELWAEQFGTPEREAVSDIDIANDGSIYVSGGSVGVMGDESMGGPDVFLMKLDSTGTRLWVTQFGSADDEFLSLVELDSDGDVYVGGITDGAMAGESAGSGDIFFGKFDSQGRELWMAQVGSGQMDFLLGMSASEGGVYLVGKTGGDMLGEAGSPGPFLLKYQMQEGASDAAGPSSEEADHD